MCRKGRKMSKEKKRRMRMRRRKRGVRGGAMGE